MLRIGVTTGDPAGIGPEISLRALRDPRLFGDCIITLFGDEQILRAQAGKLGISFDYDRVAATELLPDIELPARGFVHIPARCGEIQPGSGSAASGEAAAKNIELCAAACLQGALDAIVTAPLNKKYLHLAGYDFPGHTEFLAYLAGVHDVAMAFLTEKLKVVLATIHLSLRSAIDLITAELIQDKLRIILREFPRLNLPCRRVAVAALNPHAGENGIMGTEEREVIEPALRRFRKENPGIEIHGPLPADTLFYRAASGEFDVVLALLHDQGLSPIKLIGFGEAVNVTLGLPFVRTSVDHGTAFDIAGKGVARPESMISALRWARRLIRPAH